VEKNSMVYKSQKGKQLILDLYAKMEMKLCFQTESIVVNTRFGNTHIIIGGKNSSEPVFLFNGGNSINPFELKPFEKLIEKFKVYSPDNIGLPGKSDETRISYRNDDWGKWAVDLLDMLKIEKAIFIGQSVGGGILTKLASYAPERIKKAVFIAPMGFGYGSFLKMIIKLAIPSLIYMRNPNKENLINAVKPLFFKIDEISDEYLEVLGCIYQNSHLVSAAIKPPRKKDFIKFLAPCMLIAAQKDILHPANVIVPKAKEIIANLKVVKVIENSSHIISMQSRMEELIKFIEN
jgi:pimeloyl-ACP methyl ester carboxylesterase